MKKLIFLVCCLIILGGCTLEYNNIKPVAPTSGTIVMVDSTQWTPVLMQVNDDHISIYDGKTIKKVPVIDEVTTFLLGAFCLPVSFI